MTSQVFQHDSCKWIDVQMPSAEELQALSSEYNLHPAAVKDCLAPMHLPKTEKIGDTIFMIARVYDFGSKPDSDTIQQLTNKVAIFIKKDLIITIHRRDEPFLQELRNKWGNGHNFNEESFDFLLNQLLDRVIHSFDKAINSATTELDAMEKVIFDGTKDDIIIRKMYVVKRRASVFKRMIFMTREMIEKYIKFVSSADPYTQDLVDSTHSCFFLAEELHENANNLLNLHLSLSSHRTNEVMSFLTIISLFFLPHTFIVGVYGMNFEFMPELKSKFGYLGVWILMVGIWVFLLILVKRRGWLK
jgi:magnesium transporter